MFVKPGIKTSDILDACLESIGLALAKMLSIKYPSIFENLFSVVGDQIIRNDLGDITYNLFREAPKIVVSNK